MIVPLSYCKVAIRHTTITDTFSWRKPSAVRSQKEETYAFVSPTLNRAPRNWLWTTEHSLPTAWCMLYSYRIFSVKLSYFVFLIYHFFLTQNAFYLYFFVDHFDFFYILQFTLPPLFSYNQLQIFHRRERIKNGLGAVATFNRSRIRGRLVQDTHIKLWPGSGSAWDERSHGKHTSW